MPLLLYVLQSAKYENTDYCTIDVDSFRSCSRGSNTDHSGPTAATVNVNSTAVGVLVDAVRPYLVMGGRCAAIAIYESIPPGPVVLLTLTVASVATVGEAARTTSTLLQPLQLLST